MIKVYSTPTCSSCRVLKRFLDDNAIGYQSIDLSKLDKKELEETINRLDSMAVPVIEFEDGELIKGFDLTLIKQKLNLD